MWKTMHPNWREIPYPKKHLEEVFDDGKVIVSNSPNINNEDDYYLSHDQRKTLLEKWSVVVSRLQKKTFGEIIDRWFVSYPRRAKRKIIWSIEIVKWGKTILQKL